IVRATAENREMSEALGVDMTRVSVRVFTLGVALGTVGGALVIPATAATSEMGIELIVEAFAVVVIGGLGSMRGAFVGALIVGLLSCGHALFVALGAYTAATLTTGFRILHLEAIVGAAAGVGAVVAVPVGLLCVRYVKIYFGMLTLAFGMLFYSFLYKFYALT